MYVCASVCCVALNDDELWAPVMSHTVMSRDEGWTWRTDRQRTDKNTVCTSDVSAVISTPCPSASFKQDLFFFFFQHQCNPLHRHCSPAELSLVATVTTTGPITRLSPETHIHTQTEQVTPSLGRPAITVRPSSADSILTALGVTRMPLMKESLGSGGNNR